MHHLTKNIQKYMNVVWAEKHKHQQFDKKQIVLASIQTPADWNAASKCNLSNICLLAMGSKFITT